MKPSIKQHSSPSAARWFEFARVAAWFFLIVSILVLPLIHYRAAGYSHGIRDAVFVKYYVMASFGIVFWGLVLRLKEKIRLQVVMLALAMLASLYVVELSLGLLNANLVQAEPQDWDRRTRLAVYQDMKRNGIDATPSVAPSNFIGSLGLHEKGSESLFPLGSSVSKKTVVTCNETGEYAFFQSDRYGFNNPDTVWEIPEPEWLLTGDSFAQGTCVQAGEDIRAQLGALTGETVITLGSGGNGPLIELASLIEYAEAQEPQTVLWLYYGNDLNNLVQETSVPLLMRYLDPGASQGLVYKQREIDERLGEYISELEERAESQTPVNRKSLWSTLWSKMGWLRFGNTRALTGVDYYVYPLLGDILKEARNRVTGWGGQIYFVHLPEYHSYVNTSRVYNPYRKQEKLIYALVESLGIPIIAMHHEVFEDHPDPLAFFPLRRPGHYSSEGYREIARAIARRIRSDQERTGMR